MDSPDAGQEVIRELEEIREKRRIKAKAKRLKKQSEKEQKFQDANNIQNLGANLQLVVNLNTSPEIAPILCSNKDHDLCNAKHFPAIQDQPFSRPCNDYHNSKDQCSDRLNHHPFRYNAQEARSFRQNFASSFENYSRSYQEDLKNIRLEQENNDNGYNYKEGYIQDLPAPGPAKLNMPNAENSVDQSFYNKKPAPNLNRNALFTSVIQGQNVGSPGPSKAKSKKPFIRNINDLIVTNIHQKYPKNSSGGNNSKIYTGNPLDADKPQRFSGKFKETPVEKKFTPIKRAIQLDNEIRKATHDSSNLIKYIPYSVTKELEAKVLEFLKELVRLQRKMYDKDKTKALMNKRFVLGFSQCTKYILGNKVKLLIIPTDHKVSREEDRLFMEINKIHDLSIERNVEIMYVFTKRHLSNITKMFCSISCIAILNVDGIHNQLHAIFRDYNAIKKQTDS